MRHHDCRLSSGQSRQCRLDPFFRGLLSVLVGVVVLIGGSYLLVASNSGSRLGGLISAADYPEGGEGRIIAAP